MHSRKSIFLLCLIGCVFLCSSAFALQSGDFTYTVSGSEVTITGYTGAGGAVVIPDTIAGMPVVSIGAQAFYAKSAITSIAIPNSVMSIGNDAFMGCTGLTTVTIPSSVASMGSALYSGWPIPIYNPFPPFSNCTGLTRIDVDANNPNFSSHDGVLYDKSQTKLIQFPGGRIGGFAIPGSVTQIGAEAFRGCAGLTSVIFPAGVMFIDSFAFGGCSHLGAYFYGNSPSTSLILLIGIAV